MTEIMKELNFKYVTKRDLPRLHRYYERCDYVLCEYSAVVKHMMRDKYRPMWAEAARCLIVKNEIHGKCFFDYPVPGPEGDEAAALEAIEDWCAAHEVPLAVSVVPKEKAALLLGRYPLARIRNLRSWKDYVYEPSDLASFAGRHYAGQRNHVNKFRKLCPDARFRTLGAGDGALAEAFFDAYEKEFSKESAEARKELADAKKMMRFIGCPWILCGGLEPGGKLVSIALAERCGATLHIHIEKALYSYEGAYPATVQAFAQHFATDGVRWINREDDADDSGLRTSKLQYRPAFLAEKYSFEVENELFMLREIPTLETPRLTLSPLTDRDREAYSRLCLDDARNRWWGYDYRDDWKGEPTEDYFLNVAREDYVNHITLNFAVRLDGQCIGEAVFWRFTGRGTAELGCRIASEYAGNGYGAEAFAAAADWGIYGLKLAAVTAKCYKENAASLAMLSACMRKTGEDETFFYFRKDI